MECASYGAGADRREGIISAGEARARGRESILPGEEVAAVAGKKEETRKKSGKKSGKKVISLEREDTPSTASRSPSPSGEARGRSKAQKKAFKYPGRGAPKVYATVEELARGCERYFASISRVETLCNPVTGEQEQNSLGKPIERVVWLSQPSMGGLARSLGVSDRTLRNYAEDTDGLGPVVEWAKGVCRDWLLEEVTTRDKGSLNGLIFVLENNYGMKEQVAVEHSGMTLEEFVSGKEQEF